MPFPEIDPAAFCIGPVAVRWYALAYLGGIALAWFYLCRVVAATGATDPVGRPPLDSLLNAGIIGIILGGRLAYILFYNLDFYLANPLEVFAVWRGGMSFHGGFVGMFCAVFYVARKHGVSVIALTDLAAFGAPIGLLFGRMANFINAELYGKPTSMPWGMVFPEWQGHVCDGQWAYVDSTIRHPSQLYEAGLEGILLFAVMWFIHRRGGRNRPGLLAGVFLAGYGIARIFVEIFREPDFGVELILGLSRGQLLSLPMVAAGVVLILLARPAASRQPPSPN